MRYSPFLFLVFALACGNIPDSDLELQPTELKVKVLDDSYLPVPDAGVYLYRDYVSFTTLTGEAGFAYTDENGIASFTDLEPYNYFMYSSLTRNDNIYDNSFHYFNLADFLTENAVTSVSIKLDYLCPDPPTSLEISKIDLLPLDKNEDWTGSVNDDVFAEFVIVKNYNFSGNPYTQTILATSTNGSFKLLGKPTFGEIIFGDEDLFSATGDPISLTIDQLENDLDTYYLFLVWFSNEIDFAKRKQIFAGSVVAKGEYKADEIDISYYYYPDDDTSSGLARPINQYNAYPRKSSMGFTTTTENRYRVLLNFKWQ